MKKLYKIPSLELVHFETADIVTNSPLKMSTTGYDPNGKQWSNNRNPIWDEEE